MNADQISRAQLRALQALWAAYARHSLDAAGDADPRAARLAWASAQIGRELASFSELRSVEAIGLIDTLKAALGQRSTTWSRPRSREAARAAGTHGRKGFVVEVPMLAAPEDVARVHALRERLGISIEAFEEWLRSRSSPLGRFGDATLRTVADCNKVLWALKALLRRAG
jgi:hypothetical protein